MKCATCEKPIRIGEPYDRYDITSPNAGGTVVYYHRRCPIPKRPAAKCQ